jgi:hypothetical protein
MKHEPNIGELTTQTARDAIHIAVIPVVAKELLSPGNVVALRDGLAVTPHGGLQPVGIVDPFLKGVDTVKKGDKFWLFLYPKTVTNLRHDWSHPAFDKVVVEDKEASRAWLRNYARKHNPYHNGQTAYDNFIDNIRDGRIVFYGRDLHGRDELDDAENLMHHLSVVLGRKVTLDDFEYGCSC